MYLGGAEVTSWNGLRPGHAHPYPTRRNILAAIAGTGGLVAGSGILGPAVAWAAANPEPRPIPGGIAVGGQGFHVNNPGPMVGDDPTTIDDPSSITDFDGIVAVAHGQGAGVGNDANLGKMDLVFDVDMRFMQGRYRGTDGRVRRATFGFI